MSTNTSTSKEKMDTKAERPIFSGSSTALGRLLLLVLLLLFFSTSVFASTISARLDRSTITLGDSTTLIIDLSGAGNERPDLSPLKKDFDIINTGTSTQIQIINGHRSDRKELNITLQPHQPGQFTIPAITVGKQHTRPLKLTVKDVPAVSQSEYGQSVWIEMNSPMKKARRDVMVQQEIPVTVKLFTSLPLSDISLTAPAADHAIVEKLGDDVQYNTERNGKSYQVVEQHYVLFPEQAGDLTIKPVVLRALTPDSGQGQRRFGSSPFGRSFDDPFDDPFFKNAFGGNSQIQQMLQRSRMMLGGSQGKSITLRSNGIRFNVQHIPEEARGQPWLPARNVTLSSSWQNNPPAMVTGEPATLTITVKAEGLTGTQIPALTIAESTDSYSVYAEPAQMQSLTDGEHAIGISKQTFTIIAQKAGKMTLPEIKLPWWNTQTQKQQWAKLPALELNVKRGLASSSQNSSDNNAQNNIQSNIQSNAQSNTSARETKPDSTSLNISSALSYNKAQLMQLIKDNEGLFTVLALLLLLLGAAFYFYRTSYFYQTRTGRNRSDHSINPAQPADGQHKNAQQAIDRQKLKLSLQEAISACENGNAQQAAKSLLQWAKLAWPDLAPVSLVDIANNIVEGGDNILQLHKTLYQPQSQEDNWQDPQLAELLRKGLQRKIAKPDKTDKTTLPPLYPA